MTEVSDTGSHARVKGEFVRQRSTFRDWIAPEDFEPGRLHLYVAKACPWAHRTLIVRHLKGLEEAISVSFADPIRDERGWAFTGGPYTDALNDFGFLAEAYAATDLDYGGRISVPVLWDKRAGRIVNKESADIVRMFNTFSDEGPDLYPEPARAEI